MGRDLALERAWRERSRRQQRSGLTIQEFCEQEGLVAHQLSWWRGELKRRDAGRSKRTAQPGRKRRKPRDAGGNFLPVRITSAPQDGRTIEIVVDQPLRIAVSAGFDHQLLAEVVRVLENRRC